MRPPIARPLTGYTIAVTRAEGPAGLLSKRLAALGAKVLNWPTIRFTGPEDSAPLEEALAQLAGYDWIVFTSPRAVSAVLERCPGRPAGGRLRVAAVGAATARALAAADWPVDLVPERSEGRGLVAALADAGVSRGMKVLFPAGSLARETVPDGLAGLGARVDRVEAYRTEPSPLEFEEVLGPLEDGEVDLITFASPSAVSGLAGLLGPDRLREYLARLPVAVIGPVTAAAVLEAGGRAVFESGANDLDGLVEAAHQAIQPDNVER